VVDSISWLVLELLDDFASGSAASLGGRNVVEFFMGWCSMIQGQVRGEAVP
jgi:hypothetical protein